MINLMAEIREESKKYKNLTGKGEVGVTFSPKKKLI